MTIGKAFLEIALFALSVYSVKNKMFYAAGFLVGVAVLGLIGIF